MTRMPENVTAATLGHSVVAVAPAWRALLRAACEPYRPIGRFAYHFAAGKLRHDPAFAALLRLGLLRPGARLLDIGCGQGVLAALLRACDTTRVWPEGWAPPPRAVHYRGLDLMPRDIARARGALAGPAAMAAPTAPAAPAAPAAHAAPCHFDCADMRQAGFPTSDVVVILDVLHYADHAAQEAVLARVRDCLAPGGRLLLRVGDRQQRLGFVLSQWVDHAVTRVRGHAMPPTWTRSLAEWRGLLQGLGFAVQALPMSQGTPFANVLLVAERPSLPPVAPHGQHP